jgi:hypothetical protein
MFDIQIALLLPPEQGCLGLYMLESGVIFDVLE